MRLAPGWGGQSEPTHVVAHLSDTHLLANGALLGGHVDTVAGLEACLATIEATEQRIDAVVVSGDLVDQGDPASYRLFERLVRPVAERLEAALVVTGGNHDERGPLAEVLFGLPGHGDAPCDRSVTVNGLRLVTVDTALPGSHAGGLTDDQYRWLATQLAKPAPHGTLLVMHHGPIPYRSPIMQLLDFDDPPRLAAVLAGSDVRAILCGHLHVTTTATLGGIPVLVAGGVSYVDDVGHGRGTLAAVDAHQSWNLVEVHADTVVSTVVPARPRAGWPAISAEVIAYLDTLDPAARRAMFATKRP